LSGEVVLRVNRAESGKWISVEELLPDIGIRVFVLKRSGGVSVDRQLRYGYGSEYGWESRDDVTHWMSIEYPKPPGYQRSGAIHPEDYLTDEEIERRLQKL
jgi:hypothetical protein